MPEEKRYCILCGEEIGDSATCVKSGCGQLPNFYRDIPGPSEQLGGEPAGGAGIDDLERGAIEGRVTVSFPRAGKTPFLVDRVAVLRSVSASQEEHAIRPGTTWVGARPPANIVLDRPQISTRHARIECAMSTDGAWKIGVVDDRSTNGTFVNDDRVESAELKDGDRVRFADIEYTLHVLEQKQPRVTMQL